MDWKLFAQLAVTVLVAAAGWVAVHHLNATRDAKNKRSDLRLKHLIDVYRKLDKRFGTPINSQEAVDEICEAVSDLQLFGDPMQVAAAQKVAQSLQGNHSGSIDVHALMQELRTAIRSELRLQPTSHPAVRLVLTYHSPSGVLARSDDDT